MRIEPIDITIEQAPGYCSCSYALCTITRPDVRLFRKITWPIPLAEMSPSSEALAFPSSLSLGGGVDKHRAVDNDDDVRRFDPFERDAQLTLASTRGTPVIQAIRVNLCMSIKVDWGVATVISGVVDQVLGKSLQLCRRRVKKMEQVVVMWS